MNNTPLWRALGKNMIISFALFTCLLALLWLAEIIFPSIQLLRWNDPAWIVGIPASIIGVGYILTIRDPQNYIGFYGGILMSILLGVQFLLQSQYDSTFLYFCVFIPFQIKSIRNWSKPTDQNAEPFSPAFLSMRSMLISLLICLLITFGDYLLATFAFQHNTLGDNVAIKLFNGLLISSSVLANFWLIYRKNDAWLYWLLYSLAGIGLFILIDNIFSIVLFIFFLVINSMAGIAWIRSTKPEDMGWIKGK